MDPDNLPELYNAIGSEYVSNLFGKCSSCMNSDPESLPKEGENVHLETYFHICNSPSHTIHLIFSWLALVFANGGSECDFHSYLIPFIYL